MRRLTSPQHMADFEITLTQKMIDNFFAATGWLLENRPTVPPTIATCFRNGEMMALEKLGVSLENVLHGEQTYKYLNDLTTTGTYHGQTFLKQCHERTTAGQKMVFHILHTDICDAHGNKFIECVTTVISKAGD